MSEESRDVSFSGDRRLAAIMFTDVAGYSARMQRDEQNTLALVKADFTRLKELGAQHGGEVLNTMGDGMLLCFPSAVRAVACALQVQAEFNERRGRKPAEEALEHRIGIHVGDVFREGGQVAGDGVNIAARLQTRAPSGGICVSQMVRDTVKRKLAFQEEFLGPQNFKNIGEKISVYILTPADGTAPGRAAVGTKRRAPRLWLLGSAVALAAVAAWLLLRPAPPVTMGVKRQDQSAKPSVAPAAGVSDKSIAVLPFTNMSDEKDTGFFADGVHEDILTNLQNVRELRVLSRQSVVQYRGTAKTMRQIGQELGVAYLLEGSVRRAGNTVRVTGQLIDARTEAHVWADKYDRELRDIFAIQSELAQAIAAALKAALTPQEKSLLVHRPTENPAAYDLYLKARDSRNSEGIYRQALEKQENLLQSAVTLDPEFAAAWAELSLTLGAIYLNNYDHSEGRRVRIKVAVDAAARLAPDAPEVIRALGDYSCLVQRDYARASEQYQKFLSLRPNDPSVYWSLGNVQRRQGQWAEAWASYNRGTHLDPQNYMIARQKYFLLLITRRYDEAMKEQRRIVEMAPGRLGQTQQLALLSFWSRGSTREMEDWLAGLTEDQARSSPVIQYRKSWSRMRGDFAEAIRLDRLQPYDASADPSVAEQGEEALNAAVTLAATGDRAGADARLANLPARIRTQLEIDPTNARLWSILAQMEAVLRHKEEAIRCARQAVDLLPESIDRSDGPRYGYSLAFVYAWSGDKDRAIDEWARLFRSGPTGVRGVFELKNGPWAFPLRGDPRWEALLNDPKSNAPLF